MKKTKKTRKKTTAKVYDPDSDDELNGDFVVTEYDDNKNNYNKKHTPSAVWSRSPELTWVYFLDPCRTWYDST